MTAGDAALRKLAWLLLIASGQMFGAAAVSGKLLQPNTVATTQTAQAQLDLQNCGNNYPVAFGSSITPHIVYPISNVDGTWSGTLYRNDEISCNGSQSTWWHLTYWVAGRQVGPGRDYVCSQASCPFDSMTPLSSSPAPPTPQPPVSGARTFTFSQSTVASTWTMAHNFAIADVIASFYDLTGKQIYPDTVTETDSNTLTATFLTAQAGRALIINAGNFTPTTVNPNYIVSNPTSAQSIAGGFDFSLKGRFLPMDNNLWDLGSSTLQWRDGWFGRNLSVGGTTTTASLNGVKSADQFSGSDIGAKINAAYAALLSAGGRIYVPAGPYSYSTPITFNTAAKPATLECEPGGATTLTYTPSSGAAITLDWGQQEKVAGGVKGCRIVGPGNGTTAVGIALGSSNATAPDTSLIRDSIVTDFGTGLSAPYANGFLLSVQKSQFGRNGKSMNITGNLENSMFDESLFNNYTAVNQAGCVTINAGGDYHFTNTSFDGCQLSVAGNANVSVSGGHMENPSLDVFDFVNFTGSNSITLQGVNMLQDMAAAPPAQVITINGSGTFSEVGTSYFSAATQVNHINIAGGSPNVYVYGAQDGSNSYSGRYVGGTTTGKLVLWPDPKSGFLVQGSAANATGAANALELSGGLRITGTATLPNVLITSSITPSAAGGLNLGTAALPFSGALIGPAATNNTFIQAGNDTGSRQFNLPDQTITLTAGTVGGTGTYTTPAVTGTLVVTGSGSTNPLQTQAAAGCATGASVGATCDTTVTWPNTLTNTNYKPVCDGVGITSGVPVNGGIVTQSATAITFRTVAMTAAAAQYGNIECHAFHD